MPGIASATGLLEARIRSVSRPKPKHVELSGSAKPAPFILRPFSGIFNPYPYGCSVLCNHPADCEAKEILRRAKDLWATEGKALLLPEEMDMIRANLVAGANAIDASENVRATDPINADVANVPEELFRKYTETDSRPLTPAPTLASGLALTNRFNQEEYPVTCNPRERTTLILDLRANSKKQIESDTFTWHALTLEPPPTPRKPEVSVMKSISSGHQLCSPKPMKKVSTSLPSVVTPEPSSGRDAEEDETEKSSPKPIITHRRGKRLSKRKCRRSSGHRYQAEIRDLLEPTETQISHIGEGSRRTSIHTCNDDTENPSISPKKTFTFINISSAKSSSFIDSEILEHLSRELDWDKVEAEFSIKKKIALEEALRVKGESHTRSRSTQMNTTIPNTPRMFSRQATRFQILDSESLRGLTVLEYLSKHVFISSGRKLIFRRIFNKYQEDTLRRIKYISPDEIRKALEEVIGKPMTKEQEEYLKSMIGEIGEPLTFRSWCGVCAAVERLLCPLPQKEIDPASWLERVDFETLERRLRFVDVDSQLALFLREIREK